MLEYEEVIFGIQLRNLPSADEHVCSLFLEPVLFLWRVVGKKQSKSRLARLAVVSLETGQPSYVGHTDFV